MALTLLSDGSSYGTQRGLINAGLTLLNGTVEQVSALPASPTSGILYHLDTTDGNAPIGIYRYDDTGWMCVVQGAAIALSDWDGTDTATVIYPGVEYTVSVTAASDQLNNLTLSTFGIAQIVISNATLYTITDPTSGYKTGDSGLDSLSAASVHLTITLTGTDYEYAASERVAL